MSSSDSTDPTSTTASTTVPTYSGSFAPYVGTDPANAVTPFQLPLANVDATKQVIGQGTNVYIPGQLRKYIPTIYQQLQINTRTLLSINGYEVVDPSKTTKDANGKDVSQTTVTSDIRNSLLVGDSNDVTTAALEDSQVGMTKLVVSEDHTSDGLRKLTCVAGAKFLVHEELFDTYYFSEKGEAIEYVQVKQQASSTDGGDAEGDFAQTGSTPLTLYIVIHHMGFFTDSTDSNDQPITYVPPANSGLFIPNSDDVTPYDTYVQQAKDAETGTSSSSK